MAKNWYPILDDEKCIGCLECYKFCPHQVFVLDDNKRPKVNAPEKCVEMCMGCGKICDQKAISYSHDK